MRLYASGAPDWWPYQLVSMAGQRVPRLRRPGFYRLLVDNGMFSFYAGGRRPPLGEWLARLSWFASRVEARLRPAEVVVVLPDWLGDPGFTLEALGHPSAQRVCGRWRCIAVAHADPGAGLGAYAWTVERIAAVASARGLRLYGVAAPLKLPCSRYSPRARRRIPNPACQLSLAEQVCRTAAKHGLYCHGLGAMLSPGHLRRLAAAGVDSVDSTSWTRPVNKAAARIARRSAGSREEREQFFRALLEHLGDAVELVEAEYSRPGVSQGPGREGAPQPPAE